MSKKINDGLTAWKRSKQRRHEKSPMIECSCGCGSSFKSINKHGRKREYVSGHHARTKPKGFIDLKKPEFSYFYGFIQADGSLCLEKEKDRGRLTIELNAADSPLLKKFQKIIPYNSSLSERVRDTNFKNEYKSTVLKIYNQGFRHELLSLGMNYGKKSNVASIPNVPFSKVDFFRGIIDGDGSLGLTANRIPFLSLTTASETMKESYVEFLQSITGKLKEPNRNSRDNIYNIVIYKEDAQKVATVLYYPNCIALERKKQKAAELLLWERPEGMRKVLLSKKWDAEQDEYILTHTIEESMQHLGRTKSSIKNRVFRLKKE